MKNIKSNLLYFDRKYKKFYLIYYIHIKNNGKNISIMKEFKKYNTKELYNIRIFILSAYSFTKKLKYYIELIEDDKNYQRYKSIYFNYDDQLLIKNHFLVGQNQ